GRIVRLPGGEYIEVHQPVDTYDRWKLIDIDGYEPLVVRPNAKGRIPWTENLRAAMSRWFFEDRLAPLTQAASHVADAHQQHHVAHVDETSAEEIQGARERAGVTDEQIAPSDGRMSETGNLPSNTVALDSEASDDKKSDDA